MTKVLLADDHTLLREAPRSPLIRAIYGRWWA